MTSRVKSRAKKHIPLPKIDDQLKVLNAYWEAIQKRPRPSFHTSAEHLADQWEILEANDPSIVASSAANLRLKDSVPFVNRGKTFKGRPPLAEMFSYIEEGFYPPPELLLTLLHVWRDYKEAAGNMRLEDAFLGQPKTKSGNYAARALKQRKDIGRGIRVGSYLDKGMSKQKAIELLADELGEEVDTLKRTVKPIRHADVYKEEK